MPALPSPARKAVRYARRLGLAAGAERRAFWRSRPVRHDTVLYESFAGNGMLCNPEAIFRHLLDHPQYAHLKHVWSLSEPAAVRAFRDEFAQHPRVSFVWRGSGAFVRAVATSGYLINNATFPPQFSKRAGQVYLNTWHGTPLKLMGFDMPGGALESANTLRNFLLADYLLAANDFMAETMYDNAYRLRNVYSGQIVTEGYPRIDRQRLSDAAEADVRARLLAAGTALEDEPIVLFAPTWRGSSFNEPTDDLDRLAADTAALQLELPGYRVLLKTHQVVHALAAQRPGLARILVPNTIPTNVLLGAAAGLVTDYSSIFFDYLATGRPIAFLAPDSADYDQARGTYLPASQLPGPVHPDAAATGRALAGLLAPGAAPHARLLEWQQRFTPHDDGDATARVVDIVFGGAQKGYRVRPARNDGRTRLLLHLGGMRSNGITSSALNLLGAIDHDRYDVTALMPLFRAPAPLANQALIHPAVRQVFRIGGMNGSKLTQLRRRTDDWRGTPLEPYTEPWHSTLWDDEWTRVLGGARFDWVADFSGYSPFWATLLLHAPGVRRAIWLHNEMAADRERTVSGRARMRRSLGLVFAQYGAYDQLISVSPLLTELNRAELRAFAPEDRFVTVRNLPNVQRVAEGRIEPLAQLLEDDEEEPSWLRALAHRDPAERWFVTVGRLSPEKNQERLLRAFAQVRARRPETRLLIVGGGPLQGDLATLIEQLGLTDAAFLTGARRNPWALMAAADCFVLSSRYEGQPMVLLEAALCELPIVATSFASVGDALPGGSIRVVAQTDDALRDGMLAYLDGDVGPSRLDIAAYVGEVIRELDAAIAPGAG